MTCLPRTAAAALAAILLAAPNPARPGAPDDQSGLVPLLNQGGKELRFDWPMIKIGTAEYKEGPTGVTVFRFGRKVLAAYDVRGEPVTDPTRIGPPPLPTRRRLQLSGSQSRS